MTIPGIFLLLVLIYLSVDWIKLVRYIHNYYVGYDTYKLYKDGREGKIYHYDKALRRRVYIESMGSEFFIIGHETPGVIATKTSVISTHAMKFLTSQRNLKCFSDLRLTMNQF